MHYLFMVLGDRVKPDNILLVVLGCDKALATSVPLSDIPGAHCQHLGSKQRLQQGHGCLDQTHLKFTIGMAWEIFPVTASLTPPLFFLVLKDN